MLRKMRRITVPVGLVLLAWGLSACQSAADPAPTPLPTEQNEAEAAEPRTLVYCAGTDPGSLYLYSPVDFGINRSLVLQAIYDGPIDNRSFAYQAVILEKLPSLADGDAQLQPVTVTAGDRVVEANGSPVVLEAGVRIRPSGCQSEACAVEYDGSSAVQMDQLAATFQLLEDLTWSDGVPLTARDSVYSFELAADPDTPGTGINVKKNVVERTASYTALDELRAAWVGLPGYLDATYFSNFWSPMPEHLWGELSAAELLAAEVSTQRPVGWGPYVLVERVPDESIRLRKNEHYFRADEGLPNFEQLEFRFVGEDANENIEKLLSGECDMLDVTALVVALSIDLNEQISEPAARGQINAAITTGSAFNHLDFGIQPQSYDDGWQPGDRPDFFGDVRTRRAFALCLDRQGMVEASSSQTFVLDTYVPPQHPLYNPEVQKYEFDAAAGSALLEEVGWELGADGVRVYAGEDPRIPPGTRLSVQHDARAISNRKAMEVLVASLAECGIEVQVTYWDLPELFADGPEGIIFGRNFELTQFIWLTGAAPRCDLFLSDHIPGEDLEVFPMGWNGSNNPGFSDPAYDQACRAALQALPGQPGYVENHLKAQEIFAEQLPIIPLWLATKTAVTRADFCSQILDPSEITGTWNIEAFDYGPDC